MRDIIQTQRLDLRRPEDADASALARFINDFEVARQTGSIPHPYTRWHAEFWLTVQTANLRRRLEQAYVIERDGTLIGSVALYRPRTDMPFSIGYMLAREAWGHGYMSEAVAAVMDEAARNEVESVVAAVFTDNSASAKVLRKLGFARTGESRSFSMARMESAPVDEFIWQNEAAR